jgi:hypothetical protein
MCEKVRGIMPLSSGGSMGPIIVKVLPQPEGKKGGTCLPVCEDCPVVALDDGFDQAEDRLLVDRGLGAVRRVYGVVCEIFNVVFL